MKIEVLTKLIQNKKPHKRWLYELQSPMLYRITGVSMPDCNISCEGYRIGLIRSNVLEIVKGYAHDGLTCFPDTEANLPAGVLHDFGYQTKIWERIICDMMIRLVMQDRKAHFSRTVYAGVRLLGASHYGKQQNIKIEYL